MKYHLYKLLITISAFLLIAAACSDNSTGTEPGDLTGESVSYELSEVGDSDTNGTVTFAERVDGYTQVNVELSGVPEEEEYPVRIYSNTVLQGGDLLIELEPVGESGESVTLVSADAEGNTISYDDMITLNAHIQVHPAEDDTETVLAVADAGGNKLTGKSFTFDVEEENESGINGTVEFYERRNGTILSVIEIAGADPSQTHIARLYSADEDENGEPLFTFSSIDGETGTSYTDFYELNDETSFEFDDLEEFKGIIHIYNSDNDLSLIASAIIETENNNGG
jgi:hypothetical protein